MHAVSRVDPHFVHMHEVTKVSAKLLAALVIAGLAEGPTVFLLDAISPAFMYFARDLPYDSRKCIHFAFYISFFAFIFTTYWLGIQKTRNHSAFLCLFHCISWRYMVVNGYLNEVIH